MSWNGEGLPPVGEVCVMRDGVRDAEEVLMIGKGVIGWPVVQSTSTAKIYEVNPHFHTFEAINPELKLNREIAIKEMVEVSRWNQKVNTSGITFTFEHVLHPKSAEQLYDAGYRKITHLTDKDIENIEINPYLEGDDFIAGAKWARDYIMDGNDG